MKTVQQWLDRFLFHEVSLQLRGVSISGYIYTVSYLELHLLKRRSIAYTLIVLISLGSYACKDSGKEGGLEEKSEPEPMPEYMSDFANKFIKEGLIANNQKDKLLEDLNNQKIHSNLQLLDYCSHAVVIDLAKIEESTNSETEFLEEIAAQISSIHPDLSFSNFDGTLNVFDGYINTGGISLNHKNQSFHAYPETEDQVPMIFNQILVAEKSPYKLAVVHDYYSLDQPVDLEQNYRRFGVILVMEEQFENLVEYSLQHYNNSAIEYSKLKEDPGPQSAEGLCLPWAVPPGKSYYNLTEALRNPEDVENLYLHGEGLTELGPEIQKFVNLRTLSLVNNRLKTIPPEVGLISSLTKLNLSENQITELPAELSNLKNLEELDISYNGMKQLPEVITQMRNIKFLTLNHNQLVNLPNDFGNLNELCQLSLNNNLLETIPASVGNFKKLHYFNLSFNRLTHLPDEFFDQENLSRLILWDNSLEQLNSLIGNLKNLEDLTLRENELTYLPDELCELKNLTQLDLGGNQLSALPRCLNKLTKLKYLSMESSGQNLSEKDKNWLDAFMIKQEERMFWCRVL